MTHYIFDDHQFVDVDELGVDKLPQRLLLVPLHLRHRLIVHTRQRAEKGEDMIITVASTMKMYRAVKLQYISHCQRIQ